MMIAVKYIVAADEVGYGCWSGPLYTCAVAAPKEWAGPTGLTDSKALTSEQREALYNHLYQLPCALVSASSEYIDKVGVKTALIEAHTAAIRAMLKQYPNADVVLDGVMPLPELPQVRCVAKADALFPAVSAASIIAKVNRDAHMCQLALQYPGYGWETNAGYGTKAHEAGLARLGVTPQHRRSYAPIRDLLNKGTTK